MINQRNLRYFLGSNTSIGFYSLYNSFVSLQDGDYLHIIKGGPGCGKSSFIKMLGSAVESSGLRIEYAISPDDPDSLDGIYIPMLKMAYIDGNSPHVAETNIVSADSDYIDLGAYYDREAIPEHRAELIELYSAYKTKCEKAHSLFGAAGKLHSGWQSLLVSEAEKAAAAKRISGITVREFGKRRKGSAKITRRFLSAYTVGGFCTFPETAQSLCSRFYILDNRLKLGEFALEKVTEAACSTGRDIIVCPNPLIPNVMEAVLVPSLSMGFVASDSAFAQLPGARHIRLDALASGVKVKDDRQELRRCEKLISTLIDEGLSALKEANQIQEKIEQIYNPNVDFDGIRSLVQKHILELGLKP